MTIFTDDFALVITLVVLYLFLSLFLFLICFVLIHRYLLNRRTEKIEASSDRLLPHIYAYADGTLSRKAFADLLSSRYDVSASFRIIREMIDNLEGEQKRRLKSLLDIPAYKKFFLTSLRSRTKIDIAQACIYFERKNITDRSVIERLQELQTDSYSVISYSSTLALINATDQSIRDDALILFLKRPDSSSMAISDIIFEYYQSHPDPTAAGNRLVALVANPDVPALNAAPILKLFPELGLYEQVEDLYRLFEDPLPRDSTGRLTAAFIDVLSGMSTKDIAPIVRGKQLWESPHQFVRLATVQWMTHYYRSEFDGPLQRLASDGDLEVRVAAQRALLMAGKDRLLKKGDNSSHSSEWREMVEAELEERYAG